MLIIWLLLTIVSATQFKPNDQLELCDTSYNIVKLIFKGGYGTVYEAIDMNTNQKVAIKQMQHTSFNLKLIERESTAFRRIRDTTHVVELYCEERTTSQTFFVMELCETDLLEFVNTHYLTEKVVRAIALQLARGLQALREAHIIHADLKPDNLLLTAKPHRLKIADFGHSIVAREKTNARTGGSRPYIAPEVLQNQEFDGSIDLWAVGVLLHQLLIGECEYTRSFKTRLRAKPLQLPECQQISKEMSSLINDLLQHQKYRISFDAFVRRVEAMNENDSDSESSASEEDPDCMLYKQLCTIL